MGQNGPVRRLATFAAKGTESVGAGAEPQRSAQVCYRRISPVSVRAGEDPVSQPIAGPAEEWGVF